MVQTSVSNSKSGGNSKSILALTMDKLSSNGKCQVAEKGNESGRNGIGKVLCSILQYLLLIAILAMVSLMLANYVTFFILMRNNFESEVKIDINYPRMTKFPAVTVCNFYNGIQKSKYCAAYPKKCENNTITDFQDEIFREEISIEKRLKFLQRAEDFVTIAMADNVFNEGGEISVEPKNFTRIYFEPMINCFTTLARWTAKGHQLNETIMGRDNSGLFLELDFEQSEEINTHDYMMNPVGGFVYVHDSNTLPDIYHVNGYEVAPNEMLTISVEKTVYHRLPKPYLTGCRYYSDDQDSTPNSPLSRTQCLSECMYDQFMYSCGCLPVFFPQITIKQRVECQFVNDTGKNCFELKDQEIRTRCEASCPLGCDEEEFEAKVTRTPMAKDLNIGSNSTAYVSVLLGDLKEKHYYHVPTGVLSWRDVSLFVLWLLVEIVLFGQLFALIARTCCRPRSEVKVTDQSDKLRAIRIQPAVELEKAEEN